MTKTTVVSVVTLSQVILTGIVCVILGAMPSLGEAASQTGDRELPAPRGYVSDFASVLPHPWRDRIRSVCKDLEATAGVELVVVLVSSRAPFSSPHEYASALYKGWRIGTTLDDRGILLLAVLEDHQAAIVLGRNLIRDIPPQMLERLAAQHLEPMFHHATFGEDLYRTVVALASQVQTRPAPRGRDRNHAGVIISALLVCAGFGALWWIARPDLRHPYRRIHQGQYWGSGQGGFGGNFGGFGGGTSGEGFT